MRFAMVATNMVRTFAAPLSVAAWGLSLRGSCTLTDAAEQLEVHIMTAAEGLTVLRTSLSPQAVPTQCDHEDEIWRYTGSFRSPISAIVQSTVTVIRALNV